MTPDQARDQMLAVFKAAWDTTGHVAVYTDVPGSVPEEEAPWARAVVRHATGRQSTFTPTSAKRFEQAGTLIVQVFTPIGDGSMKAYELAQLVMTAFCQARGTVWFRNVRMQEVGASGAFEQVNVLIDFLYDDIR